MKMTFDTHTNRRDRTRRAPSGLPIPTHFDIQTNYRKSTVSIQFDMRIDLEGVRAEYELPDIPAALELVQQDVTEGVKQSTRDWMDRLGFRGEIIEPNQ